MVWRQADPVLPISDDLLKRIATSPRAVTAAGME